MHPLQQKSHVLENRKFEDVFKRVEIDVPMRVLSRNKSRIFVFLST